MSSTFLTLRHADVGAQSICIPMPSPLHRPRPRCATDLVPSGLDQRSIVGSPKGSLAGSFNGNCLAHGHYKNRPLDEMIKCMYLEGIDEAYYDRIPFSPGVHFFRHLRQHSNGKGVGPRQPRSLDLVIPETLLLDGQTKSIMRYSKQERGIVQVPLRADWERRLFRKWRHRSKLHFPSQADPVVAVLKSCLCQDKVNTTTKELGAVELEQVLQSPPENGMLQCFVRSKGNRESVYRVSWARNRKPNVFNIVSKNLFDTRNDLVHLDEDRAPLCPSVVQRGSVEVFRLRSSLLDDLRLLVGKIVAHLKQGLAREFGMFAMDFDEIVCDLVRTTKNRWCLVSLKTFKLSPAAYAEARVIKAKLASTKEEQGDYYDDHDAILAVRREHRKRACQDVTQAATRNHSQRSQIISKWAECKVCSCKFPESMNVRRTSSKRSSGPERTFITPTMALTLCNQLFLRSSDSAKQVTFLQRLNYRNDAGLLRVCGMCYALWRENSACLEAGTRFAQMLSFEHESIHLPGHPSYGPVPGSRSIVKQTRLSKPFATTPGALAESLEANYDPLIDGDTILVRVVLFFCEVLAECDGDGVSLCYKFYEDGATNYVESQEDGVVKQMRLHYFLSEEGSLKDFCIRKSVRVEATWKGQVYLGNIYFTKFLSSKLKGNQTIHSSKLVLLNQEDSSDVLRVEVWTGFCCQPIKLDHIDSNIPLFTSDAIHYLHDDYYDMRPIPNEWLKSVVIPRPAADQEGETASGTVQDEEQRTTHLSEAERQEYCEMIDRLEHGGGSQRETIEPSIVFATGAMSSEKLRKKTVLRRSWRLKQYALIWECVDFDRSGNVDAAELRSYIRQHSFNEGREHTGEYLAKPLEDWTIDEMHRHLCSWVGQSSAKSQRKFEEYDSTGKGFLEWEEVFNMAEQAFSILDPEDFSFIKTKTKHPCETHGDTRAYAIDLKCVQCTFEEFDPTIRTDVNLLDQVSSEMFAFTQKAAGMLIKRFDKSDEQQPEEATSGHKQERKATGKDAVKDEDSAPRMKAVTSARRKTAIGTPARGIRARNVETLRSTKSRPTFHGAETTPFSQEMSHRLTSSSSMQSFEHVKEQDEAELELELEAKKETILIYTKHNNAKMLRKLLNETGTTADFSLQGQTPLHLAAKIGNESMVKLLLAAKANPRRKDSMGKTATEIASEHGFERIARLLSLDCNVEED